MIVLDLDLAIGLRGNDRHRAAFAQPGTQGVAIIALVGDQIIRRRNGIDGEYGDLGVVGVAGRQQEDVGTAFLVADGVELGVPASLGRADTMSQGPPFAPPAVR